MTVLLSLLDVVLCALVAWVSGAFLLAGHGDRVVRIGFNVGLLLLVVGCVALACLPLPAAGLLRWWPMLAKLGGAMVAAGLYERRFGWRPQARALWEAVSHVWARMARRLRYRRSRSNRRSA